MNGRKPTGRRGRGGRAGASAAPALPLLLAVLLALPAPAGAMGSLPTGPSERGNEAEIVEAPLLSDMLPAQVRLLTDQEFHSVLAREIAAALVYPDPYVFSKQFKSHFGVAPSDVR